MMRLFLAVAAIVLAAGCAPAGTPQAAQPSSAASDSATANETSETPTPSSPARSRAETAFLAAITKAFADTLDDGETIAEEAYLEDGREICELAADSPWEAVQGVIDNLETDEATQRAALTQLCPKHRKVWQAGATGFGDGEHTVGKDLRPGTYRTWRRPVTDCYWERSAGNGRIIDNQLVTNAPRGITVTVRAGEGFTSRDCGPWVRA
ncbi:hypothetical protein ACFXJ8_11800 [Nonomuraea sp. NPDC059194]|uniref:hypothetical protein n=1 Tax=Nonomuraea sp. NPDC059194 TaxID=3346764 RepID=UPI003683CEDE